jgi:hypothetical protein
VFQSVADAVTIYANLVSVRNAGTNVVLEFGSFFPDGAQRFPPKDALPELRVVLSGELLEPLVELLSERLMAVRDEPRGN